MRNFFLSTLTLALVGCAHGVQIPESADDAQAMAQDEANSQKEMANEAANAKAADVVQDQAGNLVGNAAMSKAIAAELIRRNPMISDAKTLIYVNTVGQYVAQELVPSLKCRTDGTKWTDVRVGVVKSSTPSAFSLPGGLIFITTSMIQKMNSEDEFAGVIANEMVSSICGKGVPTNLAGQAANGWSDFLSSLPTKPMSRNDLMFADKYALVTLYRRGYDVTPYVTFIAKNEMSGRHMYGTERAAALQKSIAATPPITPTKSARMARWNAAKSKSI